MDARAGLQQRRDGRDNVLLCTARQSLSIHANVMHSQHRDLAPRADRQALARTNPLDRRRDWRSLSLCGQWHRSNSLRRSALYEKHRRCRKNWLIQLGPGAAGAVVGVCSSRLGTRTLPIGLSRSSSSTGQDLPSVSIQSTTKKSMCDVPDVTDT